MFYKFWNVLMLANIVAVICVDKLADGFFGGVAIGHALAATVIQIITD